MKKLLSILLIIGFSVGVANAAQTQSSQPMTMNGTNGTNHQMNGCGCSGTNGTNHQMNGCGCSGTNGTNHQMNGCSGMMGTLTN
jgi:hypothetical protein